MFEVVFGWQRVRLPDRAADFLTWLAGINVIGLDEDICRLAGDIGGALDRAGQPIGVADLCIAATAIHHGHVLVTGNTSHFDRVRALGFPLQLDNWREPAAR
ncbi:MAG: PIN domain-containing protein [Myxococcales bacterium]|nr:PIN domain-containing protein [Myxococcales bacterium]